MSEKRTILETSEKDVRVNVLQANVNGFWAVQPNVPHNDAGFNWTVNFPGDTFNPTQSAVCVSICEVDNTDPSNPTPKDGSAHPSVGSQVIRGVNYVSNAGLVRICNAR
jgi:hypothetical protein